MAKMVTAYDTRTGEALPNPVPQSWLDQGIFPHLSATTPASVAAAAPTEKRRTDAGDPPTKAAAVTALAQTPKEA